MISAMTLGASAFSSPSVVTRSAPISMVATTPASKASKVADEFAYGLPGNIAPAGNFDPAQILQGKSKSEVMRLREAELTHGRVGMLAAAGFLVQENFHPLFSADGGPAIQQIPQLPAGFLVQKNFHPLFSADGGP